MSLRIRLFLVLGALVAALVGAHGWLVRSLAGDLTAELDVVALDVGASVARVLAAFPFHEEEQGKKGERVVVRHIVRHGPAGGPADADPPPGDPGAASGFAYVFKVKEDKAGKGGEPGVPGEPAGEASHETLVIKLGGGSPGALQLRGPGLAAEVPIPRLGMQEKLALFEKRILFGSLLLLLAGLAAAAYLAHRVSAPLLRLSRAAVAVGDGQLGLAVDERAGASELRQALAAFNRMSSRLLELSQQNRRLQQERHLGEIGEIARGLAHSLRNPLHALGLSVDEIAARAQAGQPDEDGALAAAARRQIGKLDRSIRSFLVFASQSDVEQQKVDLGALAEDVALEALQDRQQGIQIEVEKTSGDLELEAVEQELRAMVQALVVNAVEASPPGGAVVLRVGHGEDPGRLRVEVDDRGSGIAPEIAARLFTPHVTTKASGSGMGLFLAQRLAASRYEGRLELLPRDGGGTRARLEIGPRSAPAGQP